MQENTRTRLIDIINTNTVIDNNERPTLLVSLPANSLDLAKAAIAGGAEGLKVHINLHHAAADFGFGPWEQEAPAIERICEMGVPVGMVPGTAECICTTAEFHSIANAGIDFVDAYLADMPAWMLDNAEDVHIMAAVSASDLPPSGFPEGLQNLSQVRMVEASILQHDDYGKPLCVRDLKNYAYLTDLMQLVNVPVIVPTQRAIRPDEVASLHKVGVRGILIGAIVTGSDPASIEKITRQFRDAVEELV